MPTRSGWGGVDPENVPARPEVPAPPTPAGPVAHREENEVEERGRTVFAQRRKWPRACLTCGGDGGMFEADGEDVEVTLCRNCLSQGKCPRCQEGLPEGWRELIENPIIEVDGKISENRPARCGRCEWEDGDSPVLDVSEDR